MRETTMFAPRFNNSGTQITVLLQDASSRFVSYTARFFNTQGTLLTSASGNLAPRGGASINTSIIAGLAGTSGAITLDHTAPYGRLTGKAVALEPSTGCSFDTLLLPKAD